MDCNTNCSGTRGNHRPQSRREKQGERKTNGNVGIRREQQSQHHNRADDEKGSPQVSAEDQEPKQGDANGEERRESSLTVIAHQ